MPTHITPKWSDDARNFTVSVIPNIKCDTSYRYIPKPILNKLGNPRKIRFSIMSENSSSSTTSREPAF